MMYAEEPRRAALDFMAGVADGWTKLDLAIWLHGPYAFATRHVPRGLRVVRDARSDAPAIDEPTLEHLLVGVRGQLLAGLELAALGSGTPDFIEDALIGQHVRRIEVHAETAWVPVDVARMRLKDRVASLFVADYLNRPGDYRRLHVCHLCEGITFEGRCPEHRVSTTVPKAAPRSRTPTLRFGTNERDMKISSR